MQRQLWVPPGHFYSPLVDSTNPAVRRSIENEATPSVTLEALGISEAVMLRWFDIVSAQYTNHPFPERAEPGCRYFCGNPNFPLADALALLTMR